MIKIGIIGIGRMGISHHAILNSNDKVKITALADNSKFMLSIMKTYLDVSVYTSWQKMLEIEELDAIIVSTPPTFHYEIIKGAFDSGLHVFVEKPFTVNLNEARELTSLFKGSGLINQVGYVNRFNDVFNSIHSLLNKGVIGEIIRFKSEMFANTISEPDDGGSSWRSSTETGGGAVFELASHAIDLVNYLIGEPDRVVGSSLNQIYSKNVEDAVSSTFLYKDGKSGSVYINWCEYSYRKPANKVEIFGTKGKIIADQHSFKIFMTTPNEEHGFRAGWNIRYITDVYRNAAIDIRGTEFSHQLAHFIDCIEIGNSENISSFSEGLRTHRIIAKIFDNNSTNIVT